MKEKNSLSFLITIMSLFLLLFGFFIFFFPFPLKTTRENKPSHKAVFFEKRSFEEGIQRVKSSNQKFDQGVKGGVVPHDFFISFIITDFFKRLSYQKPKTIILLGPNHYEKGEFKVLTSLYDWETPFGLVQPDDLMIRILIDYNLVQVNEEILPKDHSLAGIMPFIKYYLPETKVVPLLLSGYMIKEETSLLAEKLTQFSKEGAFIVSAVDFSHYLTTQKAQENDEITLRAIKDLDYQRIFKMNNDFLDSPPALVTLLMVMEKREIRKMDLLFHTNTGELQNNKYIPTTSYFSIAFY